LKTDTKAPVGSSKALFNKSHRLGHPIEFMAEIEVIESLGMLDQMPENLRRYFDIEAVARVIMLGCDIAEVEIVGRSYIADGV